MPNLLCVDDSPDLLQVLASGLTADGYTVTTCLTPTEGLARLVAQRFDCVVTDFNMPRLDGMAFAAFARANGFTKPIILWTGNPNLSHQDVGAVDAVVMKGSHPSVLLDTLHHCLCNEK